MFNQTLYKNGNSVAVTIPSDYLRELKLRDGSPVVVEKRGEEVVISSKKKQLAPNVDTKFMKMVEDFMDEHEDVLQELAKR